LKKKPKNSGVTVEAVPTCYDKAETVEEIAKELIKKHHPELVNLKIAYLWKNKQIKKGGREVATHTIRCSDLVKALCETEIVIIVSYPTYNELTDKQKRACIDHELTHILVDEDLAGNPKVRIVAHDVEEFGSVIQRHGLYKEDLVMLGRIVQTVVVKEQDGSKKVIKLRPGDDPVEKAMEEHEDDDEEFLAL
jgi:hypothetical protein